MIHPKLFLLWVLYCMKKEGTHNITLCTMKMSNLFIIQGRKKQFGEQIIILFLTEPPISSNSWHKWALAFRNSATQMFALGYGADTHCGTCNISNVVHHITQSLELLMSVMHLPLHLVIHSDTKWKGFIMIFTFVDSVICGFKCVYIYRDKIYIYILIYIIFSFIFHELQKK